MACIGCARAGRAHAPRPGGCALTILHTPDPGVEADELGEVEVTCHVNTPARQCLNQLRWQACRLGGDILYDVPDGPIRPTEQGVVYRGRVAHAHPPPLRLPPRDETSSGPEDAASPQAPEREPGSGPAQRPIDGGLEPEGAVVGGDASSAPATWGSP